MNIPNLALVLAFYTSVFKDFIVHDPSKRLCYESSARYLILRLRKEKFGLVSNSLPILGKAVETSLITGSNFVTPSGFSKHWRSELPSFMYDLFYILFDNSGHPRMSVAEEAVWAFFCIRQVCMAYSKATDIPSRMTTDEALAGFVSRVTEDPVITTPSWVLNRARMLLKHVLMDDDRLHASLEQWVTLPFGRHGPGAVAEKERGLLKWNFGNIPGADKSLYRFNQRAPVNLTDAVPNSRVTCVPKDYKSLRSICIEPKEYQFAQQGIWDVLRYIVHESPLTRNAINFNHQEYNGRLCKRDDLATLDLKDASDTVRLKLCRLLFPKEVLRELTRYRSRRISVRGDLVRPTCFASMGSALCFPVETLVFWAIAQASVHPRSLHKPLRVFGDDIVCPKEDARFIVKMLEASGFKVNVGKTCIDTPIRESCGVYTYAGKDVSIVRFKASRCESTPAWISLLDSCKQLHSRFLTKTSIAMLRHLKQFWHVPFGHFGLPNSPEGFSCQSRWNANYQRREWRFPRLEYGRRTEKFPHEYAFLYAWLVGNSTIPSQYGAVKTVKIGWIAE